MNINPDIILTFLKKQELFSHLSDRDLKELRDHFQEVFLPSGTVLMEEGQLGEDLYIVLHGRLSIYQFENDQERLIAEFGTGDVVGEIGILIDIPRTATVKTIRDTVLLKLNKTIFGQFSKRHPLVALEISKKCIQRLINKSEKKIRGHIKTVALVPTTKSDIIMQFIENLLGEMGRSLFLNFEKISKNFHWVHNNPQLIAWLNDQEFAYDYIFYLADDEDTPWTELCLRQADKVFFLCDAHQKGEIANFERIYFKNKKIEIDRCLFLLHETVDHSYSRTAEWIKHSRVSDFFHLARGETKKAFRLMTGKSVGLILSGGGARGAAHIGLLRAMDELGISIDMIGGTSIGGIISALYALGYDYKSMGEKYHEIIVPGGKLDYTFPYVSISAGKNIVKALKTYAGEHQLIEDLWTRMFCVSSNITENTEYIHDKGLLWRALRATASLPGVYPPVFDDAGLLVDGGYLNNLPVEVMRKRFHAGKIIASLITVTSEKEKYTATGESFSGWDVIKNKLKFFEDTPFKVPRIDTIMMRSMNVNDYDRQLYQATLADRCIYLEMNEYGLMDYPQYKKIIEEGYRQAIQQLNY